jgi:hypothetical protein
MHLRRRHVETKHPDTDARLDFMRHLRFVHSGDRYGIALCRDRLFDGSSAGWSRMVATELSRDTVRYNSAALLTIQRDVSGET